MELSRLEQIVAKYKRMATSARKEGKKDKANECADFAHFVEENLGLYEDQAYQTENELWEDYEVVASDSGYGGLETDDDDSY